MKQAWPREEHRAGSHHRPQLALWSALDLSISMRTRHWVQAATDKGRDLGRQQYSIRGTSQRRWLAEGRQPKRSLSRAEAERGLQFSKRVLAADEQAQCMALLLLSSAGSSSSGMPAGPFSWQKHLRKKVSGTNCSPHHRTGLKATTDSHCLPPP